MQTETSQTPQKIVRECDVLHRVVDRRGNPILGLWRKGSRYVLQYVPKGRQNATKTSLYNENGTPCATLEEAEKAVARIREQVRQQNYVTDTNALLGELVERYLHWLRTSAAKSKKTLANEEPTLRRWVEFLGPNTRVVRITAKNLQDFVLWRKQSYSEENPDFEPLSNRTVNLDVLVLGNFLRYARREGVVSFIVTEKFEPLPYTAPKRPLLSKEDLHKFLAECERKDEAGQYVHASGPDLANYVKFMAYSGARKDSAINVKWEDVRWTERHVWLRKTKYSKQDIFVDFNPALEALLTKMKSERRSEYLFPSPDSSDVASSAMRWTFEKVRKIVGMENFQIHDLRHFFVSTCVMAGIDYLTIAKWVGHADGGVLIGKVYGHLNSAHRQAAAARVFSTPVELPQNAVRHEQPAAPARSVEPPLAAPAPDSRPADSDPLTETGQSFAQTFVG